jgi:non-ribosomal peptide synthetase component F
MRKNNVTPTGCNFRHPNNAKIYCEGGFLTDSNEAIRSDASDIPCPRCNTELYLQQAKENAESRAVGSPNGVLCTGENLWLSAVRIAEVANQGVAHDVLRHMGVVTPLAPDDDSMDGFRQLCYVYSEKK